MEKRGRRSDEEEVVVDICKRYSLPLPDELSISKRETWIDSLIDRFGVRNCKRVLSASGGQLMSMAAGKCPVSERYMSSLFYLGMLYMIGITKSQLTEILDNNPVGVARIVPEEERLANERRKRSIELKKKEIQEKYFKTRWAGRLRKLGNRMDRAKRYKGTKAPILEEKKDEDEDERFFIP